MSQAGELLRQTLEVALAADDSFPRRFYDILFEQHPETRAMFHSNSAGAQRKMFAQKLVAIVDHIDDPQWVQRELAVLAVSHARYGVRPEMYPWVGDALITTLGEACGSLWSPQAEAAWRAAYARLSDAVLAAHPR